MRLLIIACIALPISAAAAEPVSQPQPKRLQFVPATPDKECPKPLMHWLDPEGSTEMRKLGELPPAEAFHAVYRRDARGCIDPVMVGYQFGRRR